MAARKFDQILARGAKAGKLPNETQKARNWYRKVAKGETISDKSIKSGFSQADRLEVRPRVGHMYMFSYDPKTKDTLPYWDGLPLIFPFKHARGGFYGINLHYLPLPLRAKLMDALYDLTSNKRYNETTRIRLSYDILNSSSKYKYFKPCVKRYLVKQATSSFVYIYPNEWDIALWLPLSRFQKASTQTVWRDSRKIIGK